MTKHTYKHGLYLLKEKLLNIFERGIPSMRYINKQIMRFRSQITHMLAVTAVWKLLQLLTERLSPANIAEFSVKYRFPATP